MESIRAAILQVSKSKQVKTQKRTFRVDPKQTWDKARNLPERQRKLAMMLPAYLAKRGASEAFATIALSHYVQHHPRIDNPFAYYNPQSESGRILSLRWNSQAEVDHHRKEDALTKAWLSGRA